MKRTLSAAAVLAVTTLLGLSACCTAKPAPTEPAAVVEPTPVEPTPTPTEPTEPTRPGAVVPPGGAIPIGSACTASGQCASGAYCQFPEAAACGEGGVAGVCTERPRICQKDCRGACGCDGKRYCNTCQAESLGVSIRHQGNCLEPIVQCGGIAGLRCPDGMTCDYGPPDTIYPDKMGVCVPDGE